MHLIAAQSLVHLPNSFRPKHANLYVAIKPRPFRNAKTDEESTTLCAFLVEFIQDGAKDTWRGHRVKHRVSSDLHHPVYGTVLCVFIRMTQISVYCDYGMFVIVRISW